MKKEHGEIIHDLEKQISKIVEKKIRSFEQSIDKIISEESQKFQRKAMTELVQQVAQEYKQGITVAHHENRLVKCALKSLGHIINKL